MTKSIVSKRSRGFSKAVAALAMVAGLTTNACSGRDGGEGDARGEESASEFNGKSRYSIKAYVPSREGGHKLIELRPTAASGELDFNEDSEVAAFPEVDTDDRSGVRSKDQQIRIDGVETDGSGNVTESGVLYEDLESSSRGIHELAHWLALDCRREYDEEIAEPSSSSLPMDAPGVFRIDAGVINSPKNHVTTFDGHLIASWYNVPINAQGLVYEPGFEVELTCDEVLYAQSQLLCTASKLIEIAESVAPVELRYTHWDADKKIIVPPQASEDRFLIRSLALEALAAFGQLGREPVIGVNVPCGQYLAMAINSPTTYKADPYHGYIFGNAEGTSVRHPFPGIKVVDGAHNETTPDNSWLTYHIQPRARLWVEHHRAAQLLLNGLVEDSVRGNLGQAERLRTEGGLGAMWGNDVEIVPNSLRAAVGTLFGRLEIDEKISSTAAVTGLTGGQVSEYVPRDDPHCGGVARLRDWPDEEDIVDALGGAFEARLADAPPETLAQQRAQSMVERLGLVMALEDITQHASSLLPALREQMVIHEARRAIEAKNASDTQWTAPAYDENYETSDPDNELMLEIESIEAERGAAYDAQIAGLSDEDAVFAFRTNLALYIQLTQKSWSDPLPDFGDEAGIVRLADLEGQAFGAIGGKVMSAESDSPTGLPRPLLGGDVFARMAGAITSSQCMGDSSSDPKADLAAPYQDVGQLAKALDRNAWSVGMFPSSLDTETKKALESVRAQFGASNAVDGITGGALAKGAVSDEWFLTLYRLEALLGDDGSTYSLVYGKPWEADCVAGLRKLCGDNFDPYLLERVGTIAGAYNDWAHGTWFTIKFREESGAPLPQLDDGDKVEDEFVFVIRDARPDRPGKILAAVKPTESRVVFSISRQQRQLANEIFSMSGARLKGDQCLEGTGTGLPEASCLEGIVRNQYVPLANDLTTQGGEGEDSWKHYLALAKESAALADDLGRQMVDLGTTRELRREAAQEELAGLCGTYVDVDDLSAADGGVESGGSSEINACVNPETVPIVFFQGSPTDQGNQDWRDRAETDVHATHYCQEVDPSAEICQAWPGPDAFKLAALGLPKPPIADRPPGIEGCNDVLGKEFAEGGAETTPAASWLVNNKLPKNVAKLILTDPYSPSELSSAAGKLKFVEDLDGKWTLWHNSVTPLFAGDISSSTDINVASVEALTTRQQAFPLCKRVKVDGEHSCSEAAEAIGRALGRWEAATNAAEWRLEEDKLRRFAEGGLWHMARLTGYIPQGAFELAIPVRNFSERQDLGSDVTTIYSQGLFTEVGGLYSLSAAGQFYDQDQFFLTSLEPLPSATMNYRDTLSYAHDYIHPRAAVWERAVDYHSAHPNLYVARPYGNRATLLGPVKNLAESEPCFIFASTYPDCLDFQSSDPTVGVLDWLQWVVDGGQYADQAFLSTVDDLNQGNNATGNYNTLRHGTLYSYVVRRECKRDKRSTGTLAELVPYVGSHAQEWARTYPQKCDSESDGWIEYDCATTEGLINRGTCTNNGSAVSCSGTERDWDKASGGYDDISNCKERTSEFEEVLLSATVWPPSARVHHFVDPGPSAEQALIAMGVLSCLADGPGPAGDLAVPQITDPSQVAAIRQYINNRADSLAEQQRYMFLENVPSEVVQAFQNGEAVYGAVGKGQRGDQVIAVAQALVSAHEGAKQAYSGIRRMGDAIESAEVAFKGQEIQRDLQLSEIAVSRANTIARIASGAAELADAAMGGFKLKSLADFGTSDASKGAAATADLIAAGAVMGELGKQKSLSEQQYDNSVTGVLQQLNSDVADALEIAEAGMGQMRQAQLDAMRALNQLESIQADAGFQAAKASGGDFAEINGQQVALPVNTVYRRGFDVLKLRYRRALDTAKRYAYLARLSIEQRLGVRMETLREELGAMPAPSTWVGGLCSLSGVDYDALRSAVDSDDIDGGSAAISEDEIVRGFADQYIGDYVRQLEEFVEFYNVEHPFHEEHDAAVLSLRDDLLYGDATCQREARNLLYHSDALGEGASLEEVNVSSELSVGGWSITGCIEPEGSDIGACLVVDDELTADESAPTAAEVGVAYLEVTTTESTSKVLPVPPSGGGVSLLRTPGATIDVDEDWPEEVTDDPIDAFDTRPSLTTYQTVWLPKGAYYRLSWLDMSRDLAGAPTNVAQPYVAAVYGESWSPVFYQEMAAAASGNDTDWSGRHAYEVFIPEDGYYHVAFSPTVDDSQGAVAIANVQLELFQPDGLLPYEATTGTRKINATDCGAGNPEMLRKAFVRKCEWDRCYFELAKPIQLTGRHIADGDLGLPGIAAENYNYRHGTVALNLVGTGVTDCEGADESCYAQAFIEYDLEHSAHNTELRDYSNVPRCFNFGGGAVRHGKALAAERYLGVPLGSADAALIGGPEFSKIALRGRPLTGQYTLRIYESPELRWENVEDIQLVMNYRYWSRVAAHGN